MSPRLSSTPQLDRLISESKQVTSDLMALRHELVRCATSRTNEKRRMPADRAYLIMDNLHAMSRELHELWEAMIHPPKEIEHVREFKEQRTLTLHDGQLRLGNGGR